MWLLSVFGTVRPDLLVLWYSVCSWNEKVSVSRVSGGAINNTSAQTEKLTLGKISLNGSLKISTGTLARAYPTCAMTWGWIHGPTARAAGTQHHNGA